MKVSAFVIATTILASVALPTGGTTAAVQSSAEQEVLDAIESCWDAWMDGVEQGDIELFFAGCKVDEDALYWWSVEGAPNGYDQIRRTWDTISQQDERWVDFRPVGIRVFDDVAIVNFYGYWQASTPAGSVVTEHKRTEVFQRRADGWTFIGGHSTPASPADADPYR